ncbi:helix-turn-helix domain-containing protein [Spongiibacter sp. KMU-166]|uniref:Helix-turn-helix domain-containing protein n=1 Tax=Spongiibacter thalassae TaxID=2721624 RepID=A0ABX1GFA5_9GAMM|nr:helix-turn-helix domain-containing protein [Spongiibacter thalassae]NKI17621.1 helix-turn-helix domain-containing protein [Spongiibacter thalassae]
MKESHNDIYSGPPGSVLQEARLQAGKSVAETAEALNLLKTYVEALERNDYTRFNSPLFARGYIKSYARYMGLEEAPLLRDCDRICRRDDEAASKRSVKPGSRAPGHAKAYLLCAAALLLWVCSYFFFGMGNRSDVDVTVMSERYAPLPELRAQPSLGETLLQMPALEEGDTSTEDGTPAVIEFTVAEDVWIELRDIHGKVVLSGIRPAGEQHKMTVDGPVQLTMSYWPAVSVQYNEQPVDLSAVAESNAVRVQIGEL